MKPKVIAYSDNVCPYCTIGARRIEKLQDEMNFEVEWRPFELHPEVSAEGVSHDDYFQGSTTQMVNNVIDYGKDVALNIKTRSLYNSKNSLKVNEYAKREGKFEEFHHAIFKAYLEDDRNIGNLKILLDIAEEVGLDRIKAQTFIDSSEAEELVMNSKNEALRLGINSVPSFIINNNLIRGAHPYDSMKELFTKAMALDDSGIELA
jgi:predicted DsbA family dithiol-disulfide isomerase